MNDEQIIRILKLSLFLLGFVAAVAIGVAIVTH